MLGLQHLNVPHLRGRTGGRQEEENNSDEDLEQAEQKGKVESETTDSNKLDESDKPDQIETKGVKGQTNLKSRRGVEAENARRRSRTGQEKPTGWVEVHMPEREHER